MRIMLIKEMKVKMIKAMAEVFFVNFATTKK